MNLEVRTRGLFNDGIISCFARIPHPPTHTNTHTPPPPPLLRPFIAFPGFPSKGKSHIPVVVTIAGDCETIL